MAGGPDLPETPAPLKCIQHYLKIATNHDQRDPVVSYWCRLYALQTGLKASTKTTEETNFLLKLMDWLEVRKKELHENEAITNDVAAQAHLENWALKLFLYADKNDRESNFGKSVVQSFFTAGLLYDVLTVFGELTDEAIQNRKYAKWKAAYIHNCLKNGETPVPGPAGEDQESLGQDDNPSEEATDVNVPSPINPGPPTDLSKTLYNTGNGSNGGTATPSSEGFTPTMKTDGGAELTVEQVGKAQKFIKWAGSALNYDDVSTAIVNLRKALHLLTTGEEPA